MALSESRAFTAATAMPLENQMITFERMKGTIGTLIFLWSGIEGELTDSVRMLCDGKVAKSAHGISRSLEMWSERVISKDDSRSLQATLCARVVELLKEALVVRNLVCHGLVGICADGRSAHLHVKLGTDERLLSWNDLDEMFRWMSRTKWLIGALTKAAMEGDTNRAGARLRGWKDFPGIAVPNDLVRIPAARPQLCE